MREMQKRPGEGSLALDLAEVRVGRVQGARSPLHPHQLALALAQAFVPLRRKAVVGIELEDQHVLAIVAEESVAIAVLGGVGAAAVPALAVEDDNRAGRRRRLYLM